MRYLPLVLFFIPLLTFAETSLWRVSQGNNWLNLGGSVHLLGAGDHPLPDEFEQAFRESDVLVLETDSAGLDKPEAQIDLAKRLMYKDGKTLQSALRPATYKALARYCRSVGMDVQDMNTMKPALVVLTLSVTKLAKSGVGPDAGVDQFFQDKAKKQGKPVKGLESVATQMAALENMGAGQEDALILSTIKDLQKSEVFFTNITKAWRTGNLAELEKLGIQPMQKEFPALNRSLLTSRNDAWLESIAKLIKTPEREFVLVGTLHLAGKQGLLAQLQKRGFTLQKY